MAGLIAGGDAPYVTELRTLRDEVEDLEKRNDTLTRSLAETEEALDKERNALRETNAQLTTEKSRAAGHDEVVSRMRAEIKDYQAQLQNRKDRIQLMNVDDDQIRKQLREKNGEISKYLTEIEELSRENAQMSKDVEILNRELEVAINELEKKEREEREAQHHLANNELLIDQMTAEKHALRTKLEDLTTQLESTGLQDARFLDELQSEVQNYQHAVREHEHVSLEQATEIDRLRSQVAGLAEELSLYNIDSLNRQMSEKDRVIEQLTQQVQEAARDFELLSVDWDQVDQALRSRGGGKQSKRDMDAIQIQLETVARMKERVQAYRQRHRKLASQVRNADTQLERREREVVELRQRMEEYESGVYGLPEAVREINQLKLHLRVRKKEVLSRTKQINEMDKQLSILADENAEYRKKLGLKRSSIDLSKIRGALSVELEQSRALNAQLQGEIDALEDERLRLKAAMRLRALERGEKGARMGLTAEEMVDLEAYVDKMRARHHSEKGGRRRPLSMPAQHHTRQAVVGDELLEKLSVELERAQIDAGEAREEVKRLQADFMRVKDDNRCFEAAIKEMSLAMIKLQAASRTTDGKADGAAKKPNMNVVQKLCDILERKTKLSSAQAFGGSQAGDHILEVNKSLCETLTTERAHSASLQSQLTSLQSQLSSLTEDRNHWREAAEQPLKNLVVELPPDLQMGSQDDYVALVGKLAGCMEALRRKDRALEESEAALERYKSSYTTLATRQRHLSRAFQLSRDEHEKDLASTQRRLRDTEARQQRAEAAVRDVQEALTRFAAAGGSEEALRSELAETERKYFQLRLEHGDLVTDVERVRESEAEVTRQKTKLETQIQDLSTKAGSRILHLESITRGHASHITRLLDQLTDSVSQSEHTQLTSHLEVQTARTRDLLERQQDWLTERDRLMQQVRTLQLAVDDAARTQVQLVAAEAKAAEMEAALLSLKTDGGSQSQLADLRHQLATQATQLTVAHTRSELAETQAGLARQAEAEISRRLEEMTRLYTEARAETAQVREAEAELRGAYAGGATREVHELVVARVVELEATVETLKRENEELKSGMNTAAGLAEDLGRLREIDQRELVGLRKEARKTIGDHAGSSAVAMSETIQKLQMEVAELQRGEAGSVREIAELKEQNRRDQEKILETEQDLHHQRTLVSTLRQTHIHRIRSLQHTISDIRLRLAGSVALDRFERTASRVTELISQLDELHTQLQTAREAQTAAEDAAAEASLLTTSQQSLIEALQAEAAAAAGSPNSTTTTTARLASWHAKLTSSQLTTLRLQRQLDAAQSTNSAQSQDISRLSARLQGLETAHVALQATLDARQLQWEANETQLEMHVRALEDERDRIIAGVGQAAMDEAVALLGASESSGDDEGSGDQRKPMPVGERLEAALRLLVDRGRAVTVQEIKIAALQGRLDDVQRRLDDANGELSASRTEVATLKLQLSQAELHQTPATVHAARPDPDAAGAGGDAPTAPVSHGYDSTTIHIAQDTISSLQRQMAAKDTLIEKYRAMLRDAQVEMDRQKEEWRVVVRERNEVIAMLKDKEVERLLEKDGGGVEGAALEGSVMAPAGALGVQGLQEGV
ncbi:uncharacterized protein EV422DRAFT_98258 [Fimicolochytrium jonesii]|uniref:uncharacterized protein n=1 Tax=Fimicolochytrium jonesii TaxID=1396493 RepID=UPI0022FF17A3|nr:uncharacterized protein EV422DRAFT_98258 [Fimicolochytrium jonesii]KAI8819593.1 hypothetical protein EV422DRAFT_98258 [Fimicolochytrium jonesii]